MYNVPRVAGEVAGEAALDENGQPRLLGRNVSAKQMEPVQSGETMIRASLGADVFMSMSRSSAARHATARGGARCESEQVV